MASWFFGNTWSHGPVSVPYGFRIKGAHKVTIRVRAWKHPYDQSCGLYGTRKGCQTYNRLGQGIPLDYDQRKE